jgi:hypothetical protein
MKENYPNVDCNVDEGYRRELSFIKKIKDYV